MSETNAGRLMAAEESELTLAEIERMAQAAAIDLKRRKRERDG
jgi:hypothetical protein